MRPASIVNFERLYLGAILLGLVNFYLSWDESAAMLRAVPGMPAGNGLLYAAVGISLFLQLLLLYFIARRASVVAKWVLIVWIGIGLVGLVGNLGAGTTLGTLSTAMTIVTTLLQLAAIWMLFRPDTKAWFADGVDDPGGK